METELKNDNNIEIWLSKLRNDYYNQKAQEVREKRNEVPALDGKYIYEKFQLESMEFVLTDIFRQNKNSEIVKNSMILRQYIDENINPTQFNLTYKKNEIERIYGENFIDLYLQNKENSIVITKTNIRALYLSKLSSNLFVPI